MSYRQPARRALGAEDVPTWPLDPSEFWLNQPSDCWGSEGSVSGGCASRAPAPNAPRLDEYLAAECAEGRQIYATEPEPGHPDDRVFVFSGTAPPQTSSAWLPFSPVPCPDDAADVDDRPGGGVDLELIGAACLKAHRDGVEVHLSREVTDPETGDRGDWVRYDTERDDCVIYRKGSSLRGAAALLGGISLALAGGWYLTKGGRR